MKTTYHQISNFFFDKIHSNAIFSQKWVIFFKMVSPLRNFVEKSGIRFFNGFKKDLLLVRWKYREALMWSMG